jgi:hypothetical protein
VEVIEEVNRRVRGVILEQRCGSGSVEVEHARELTSRGWDLKDIWWAEDESQRIKPE